MLRIWTLAAGDNAAGKRSDVRGLRMQTVEHTPADLLEPLLKAPPKKKLDALELVRPFGKQRLMPFTAIGIDRGA